MGSVKVPAQQQFTQLGKEGPVTGDIESLVPPGDPCSPSARSPFLKRLDGERAGLRDQR